MANKMLIDASHPEETRVVVVRGNRIEEFDFESQDKKQLKGNIYLARVTRVEPSLQAAFVEYGGNRHGFLAFSEIHPDYYQIPVADRQALLRAEAEEHAEEDDEDGETRHNKGRKRRRGGRAHPRDEGKASAAAAEDTASDEPHAGEEAGAEEASADDIAAEMAEASPDEGSGDGDAGDGPTSIAAAVEHESISEPVEAQAAGGGEGDDANVEEIHSSGDDNEVESVGAEDAIEEARSRRRPVRRTYKIQEVIKRRQILLVQVVKEERGNKGAALTTYLSLAGRYSVLMPNTARGGGISRKITNAQDRKRLKEVVQELGVPNGMGVILRTAGESRTKAEIKRDYEYLMRMWENVRSLTLQSTAPALVYEEGSLIKRSVRDLYNKDIDEILVAGEDGYREAKDFMRMLMPSHAKVVQPYRDTTPIFARSGIEAQLDKMLHPQVTLKSGGYIIINQTEALVSIDVNSGRSTREHSIEDTALQTNLEAAEEVARQLRLRDLAGLIVIDFIDMEENRNNRSVEKKLKDCLKNDRARIQVGRISHFGLLEMSRQRIRASVLESTMKPCPHCGGTGHVRSDSSVALHVVRAIEDYLLKDARHNITVRTPTSTALYVLNHKRATLAELEARFGLTISVEPDETVASQHYAIFRGAAVENPVTQPPAPAIYADEPEDEIVVEDEEEVSETADAAENGRAASGEDRDGQRNRKRRRRRRRGRDRDGHGEDQQPGQDEPDAAQAAEASEEEDGDEAEQDEATAAGGDAAGRKRRRGKRGGKRHRKDEAGVEASEADASLPEDIVGGFAEEDEAAVAPVAQPSDAEAPEAVTEASAETAEVVEEPKPAKRKRAGEARKPRGRKAAEAATEPEAVAAEAGTAIEVPDQAADDRKPEAKPARPARRTRRPAAEAPAAEAAPAEQPVTDEEPVAAEQPAEDESRPKRGGWWQRKSFF